MYETSMPISSNGRQRIALTGFSNVLQAAGGKCKTVFIQTKVASAAAGLVGNADIVLVGIGSDPGTDSSFTGIALAAGEMLTLGIDDLSQLYFRGADGDAVILTPIF